MKLRCTFLRPDAKLPQRMTAQSAGFDLFACTKEPITLRARQRALVPTGIAIEVPPGFEAQIRPRSGLASKHGITVLNSPGTIDADYRGELNIILFNSSELDFIITAQMRIAQMVICPIAPAELEYVEALSNTDRGAGGFGHTGH